MNRLSFILIQPTTLSSCPSPFSTHLDMSTSTDPRSTLSTAAPSPQTMTSSLMDLLSASSVPCSSSTRSSSPTIDIAALAKGGVELWIAVESQKHTLVFMVSRRESCISARFRNRILAFMVSRGKSYISVNSRKRKVVFMVSRRVSDNAAGQTDRTSCDVNLRDLSQLEHPDARRPDPTDTTDFWRNLQRQLSEFDLVQLNSGFSSSRYRLPNLRDRTRSRMSLRALQDGCV